MSVLAFPMVEERSNILEPETLVVEAARLSVPAFSMVEERLDILNRARDLVGGGGELVGARVLDGRREAGHLSPVRPGWWKRGRACLSPGPGC